MDPPLAVPSKLTQSFVQLGNCPHALLAHLVRVRSGTFKTHKIQGYNPILSNISRCTTVHIKYTFGSLQYSLHFPDSSVGKESTCNTGDPTSIPGSGKCAWRRDRLPTPVFLDFPCGSAGKESACNVGDLGLIPGLGRSPGEGKGYPF